MQTHSANYLTRVTIRGPQPPKLILMSETLQSSQVHARQIRQWTDRDPVLTLVRNLALQGWRNVEDDELCPFTKFSIVIRGDIADYVFLPDIDQENVSVAGWYVEREHGTCTCVSCEGGCISVSVVWYGGSVGCVSIVRVDVCLSLSGGMWWECGICDSCEG